MVSDSTESFTSLNDARTSFKSERAEGLVMGRGEGVDMMEDGMIDKTSTTRYNERVGVGT